MAEIFVHPVHSAHRIDRVVDPATRHVHVFAVAQQPCQQVGHQVREEEHTERIGDQLMMWRYLGPVQVTPEEVKHKRYRNDGRTKRRERGNDPRAFALLLMIWSCKQRMRKQLVHNLN